VKTCRRSGTDFRNWLIFMQVGDPGKAEKFGHQLTCPNVSNSNCSEWSTIQGVIARGISKSDEREARGRFEITSAITP